MDYERPPKWRRLSSSRLVRIDPKDPCYNFNFLGLPLDIKLLIICRYLSVKDILAMSLINKNYRLFIDEHFLRKEVEIPRCLDEFEGIKEDRYVLSLKVDLYDRDYRYDQSDANRERRVEVVKNLNLSKMKNLSIVHTNDVHDEPNRIMARHFYSICRYYTAISGSVFRNPSYLRSVDLRLCSCKNSQIAVEALSSNAPYLRKVILRGATGGFFTHVGDEDTDNCSLSVLIASLLENTAITHLELVNFNENSNNWCYEHKIGGLNLLRLQSKSLKSLIFATIFWPHGYHIDDITFIRMRCPNLVEMKIIPDPSSRRCLFHCGNKIKGLTTSLAKYSPKLKWFNDMRVPEHTWYSIKDNGGIVRKKFPLCSKKCELYSPHFTQPNIYMYSWF